jgi:hypothetical protein
MAANLSQIIWGILECDWPIEPKWKKLEGLQLFEACKYNSSIFKNKDDRNEAYNYLLEDLGFDPRTTYKISINEMIIINAAQHLSNFKGEWQLLPGNLQFDLTYIQRLQYKRKYEVFYTTRWKT